ncbi:unnamed protein product [Darwinula stevensoni]|uniref:G-protein coupled receptors family 1 profile domain-containing protein n=1 Tax=Darwinula stevensoni TaxID=69355 RepID=A0A7R9ACM9_9CRUS|nr:unnamed protein product [Darwinula stevensoni]CAG0900326.1 unnamed protein product [Darwinula stevensoni]
MESSPSPTYIGDNAPEEFLPYISEHWLKFLAPNPSMNYVLGIIYIFFMIFSLFGNGFILFLIIRCPSLQSCSNCLVGSLATADFLMMLKTPVFIIQSFQQGPTLGSLGCQLYGAIGFLSGFAAIWSVMAIAIDRYLVFANPFDMGRRLDRKRTTILITCIWSSSALFTVAPFLGFSRYVPEGYLTSCTIDYLSSDWKKRAFIILCGSIGWLIPLCIIMFCYVGIIRVTRKSDEALLLLTRRDGGSLAVSVFLEKRKMQRRLNRSVLMVVVIWMLSWTPYAAVVLVGSLWSQYLTPGMSMIPALACKASACINPYIYGIRNPQFLAEVKRFFSWPRGRTPSQRRELISLSEFRGHRDRSINE